MSFDSIFLHSGFRTGGSALAFAFRATKGFELWYDPLNILLLDPETANNFSTDSWKSNHLKGQKYFEEYNKIPNSKLELKLIKELRYDYFAKEFSVEFIEYISKLKELSEKQGLIPIFKFETSEGRIELIKEHFPSSLNLGVLREFEMQELSFLEQKVQGNDFFFDEVNRIVSSNPDKFQIDKHSILELNDLSINLANLRKYEIGRRELLAKCDVIIDLTNSDTSLQSLQKAKKALGDEAIPWDLLINSYFKQPLNIDYKKKLRSSYLNILDLAGKLNLLSAEVELTQSSKNESTQI